MKGCYFFLSLLLLAVPGLYAQQSIASYVKNNTTPIRTVSIDSSDFSDLEAFGNAIGNAQVVMLGEQDHGDAPAFLLKSRIVRYLHEKKGFNVLAFESDFFGLTHGWERLDKSNLSSVGKFAQENIYPVWSACTACDSLLLSYIPSQVNSSRPLILAGIDPSMYLAYSPLKAVQDIDSIIRLYQLPISRQADYISELLPAMRLTWPSAKDSSSFAKRRTIYYQVLQEMEQSSEVPAIWKLLMKNMIVFNTLALQDLKKDYWERKNMRDHQMAENLNWLATQKFPNERIIVWAHNYHISKYAGHYPEDFMNNAQPMSSIFTEDTALAASTYVLGFTSKKGTAGRLKRVTKIYTVPKPNKRGFEYWIDSNLPYGFVDFTPYNQSISNPEMFYMSGSIKGNTLHSNHKAYWTKIFDGVMYIRDMYPCKGNVR